MAQCQDCKQEMLRVDSCSFSKLNWIPKHGTPVEYKRLKNGEEKFSFGRCHDCNVALGSYHHLGCDVEECPRCGGQWISCDCHEQGEFEVRR